MMYDLQVKLSSVRSTEFFLGLTDVFVRSHNSLPTPWKHPLSLPLGIYHLRWLQLLFDEKSTLKGKKLLNNFKDVRIVTLRNCHAHLFKLVQQNHFH